VSIITLKIKDGISGTEPKHSSRATNSWCEVSLVRRYWLSLTGSRPRPFTIAASPNEEHLSGFAEAFLALFKQQKNVIPKHRKSQ
jgi:hypothetical protein